MTRLLSVMKIDVLVQVRNHLYTIGIVAAAITAGMVAWLSSADQLFSIVPTLLLLVVGGTTFLYVGALIFFEKYKGTLNATIVSPVRPSEYLWSKIITLTGLATLESTIMVGVAMLAMGFFETVALRQSRRGCRPACGPAPAAPSRPGLHRWGRGLRRAGNGRSPPTA